MALYCSDACRSKAQVRRNGRMVELRNAGKPLEEIAALVGSSVEAVVAHLELQAA